MVLCPVGLDNPYSQPEKPELPRNLNLFYNRSHADSDTRERKEESIRKLGLELSDK